MDVKLVEKEPDHTCQVETEPAQSSREHVQRRVLVESAGERCWRIDGRGSGGGAEIGGRLEEDLTTSIS